MDYMKNSACFDDKNTIDYFINLKKYYELKSKDEENANKFLKTQPPSFHKYKKRLEKSHKKSRQLSNNLFIISNIFFN